MPYYHVFCAAQHDDPRLWYRYGQIDHHSPKQVRQCCLPLLSNSATVVIGVPVHGTGPPHFRQGFGSTPGQDGVCILHCQLFGYALFVRSCTISCQCRSGILVINFASCSREMFKFPLCQFLHFYSLIVELSDPLLTFRHFLQGFDMTFPPGLASLLWLPSGSDSPVLCFMQCI